jgi:metallophosphoesterase (TIGR00282 family)
MRILAIGDIVGHPGRRAVAALLPKLLRKCDIDFVIANAENAAGGIGVTFEVGRELLGLGIDVLTLGNHAWGKREAYDYLDSEPAIIRPANYPPGGPGRGYALVKSRSGVTVGVVNLAGRVFSANALDCPFRAADSIIEELSVSTRIILADFHAEATSEKVALGHYLDGRASAVFGTHTHVQTADARVLPGGTGYVTDLGMSGPEDSVIGIRKDIVVERFLTQLPSRFEVAAGPAGLHGAVFDIDAATGRTLDVRLVAILESE